METPRICATVEISTKETELGKCGRSLSDGKCPVHGHFTIAPTRWMIDQNNVIRPTDGTNEPYVFKISGQTLVDLGILSMCVGLLLFLVGMDIQILRVVGISLLALGAQVWVTAKCWFK